MPLIPGETLGNEAKVWTLVGQDQGFTTEFRGQYIAEGMEENSGSTLGETTALGKEKPNHQWLHGDSENFTFTSRIFASNAFNNIRQQIELLKTFSKRNKELKRSPRALFTAGTEIGFTCFVRSVRYLYDELRDDGSLRSVVVNVTLQKIEDTITANAAASLTAQIKFSFGQIQAGAALFAQSARGLINIPGGSLHTIGRKYKAKQGDTFEQIAAREYGNPLLGDVLRRAQPQLEPITPATEITLVDATDIRSIRVTQQSVFLKNTAENLALRREKLAERNRATVILV